MLDVVPENGEKLCVSCASRKLFRHFESTENSEPYTCTECKESGHFAHSDEVCNTTSCADEPYAFLV